MVKMSGLAAKGHIRQRQRRGGRAEEGGEIENERVLDSGRQEVRNIWPMAVSRRPEMSLRSFGVRYHGVSSP
jgi:hypothetical protein